ncbi:MAG TPA: ATP-dependent RNA helicase HrpA [Nakamurella multipartita]|nr:ATP-dependent RNA helicase HrpA [Nakamurella multipartita]
MSVHQAPDAERTERLADLTIVDRRRLQGRLRSAERIPDPAKRDLVLAEIDHQLEAGAARLARRQAAVPTITFPAQLPVSARVQDLARTIAEHQVVIVAGETGSGKSTQLPKLCLQLGRGVRGMIGHTQPRRIAARALAERIAEETGTQLGGAIGYSIRFGDHTGPTTLVKLMTDGILLTEIARDRMLWAYDTIIIDEAHERSLNIDFLLGYLQGLLPQRPDLKLIITSATIDPGKFSRHFADAPVVEVSGRTFPVEIRYRPYGLDALPEVDDPDAEQSRGSSESADQGQAITAAVDELLAAGDGDILVFLSGEREITDTTEVLRGHLAGRRGLTEVLPLYGRLSSADQHKVFSAHPGRRIVLSTNVAETSLTVPGIRYVIDPGTARISRYSPRSKVQRLPIEPISQASAGQRAGRCGRVANGICIRLYSEKDFDERPAYTDPEIARTSLASVILQMAALELGDIVDFPFLDPPDQRQITDGVTVLTELGAIDRSAGDRVRLTPTGREMADLPLDPRLARMLVEGERRNVRREMLVLVSALAVIDVREYPLDERDKATAAHARFVDGNSDFNALISLWAYLEEQAKTQSGNAFRRMCRREYLNYLRIREWQDLHAQLSQLLDGGRRRGGRRRPDRPAPADRGSLPQRRDPDATQGGRGSLAVDVDTERVHTALLAGLLSHIGLRKEGTREYQGTRGISYSIWPGSALARTGPVLVVAAELVETSRLWARICARVEPGWVEQVGADLLRRNYSEPRWNGKRASVEATEKVTLLGVTLIAARTVQFDRIDPELSRELFIRHALVERDWQTRHRFFADNQRALEQVTEWEERARRRDILIDDDTMFALYDARIPPQVTSGRHFDSWWKKASRTQPDLLTLTPDMLIAAGAERFDSAAFPDRFTSGEVELPLDYVFDPGRADDGVTVSIPLPVLARVDPAGFEAQIPGLRADLAVALIRTLPKTLRRNFVPAPDFARAALDRIDAARPLAEELAGALTRMTGVVVRTADFDPDKVPEHLRMNFRIVDEHGATVASGRDLPTLQSTLRTDTQRAVVQATKSLERHGLTAFPEPGVPRRVRARVAGHEVTGYPALVVEGPGTVGVAVFESEADQRRAMRAGTIELLATALTPSLTRVRQLLTREQQITLATAPGTTIPTLVADATRAAVDALLDWAGGPSWSAAGFAAVRTKLTPSMLTSVRDVLAAAETVLSAAGAAARALDTAERGPGAAAVADLTRDMRAQWRAAVAPGFIVATGAAGLPDRARQLQALRIRAERVREAAGRDRERLAEIRVLQAEVDRAVEELPEERRSDPDVQALHHLLAEYRVALFAQPMRTSVPVSAKRIRSAAAALGG